MSNVDFGSSGDGVVDVRASIVDFGRDRCALSERLKFTVRRHMFNKDFLPSGDGVVRQGGRDAPDRRVPQALALHRHEVRTPHNLLV